MHLHCYNFKKRALCTHCMIHCHFLTEAETVISATMAAHTIPSLKSWGNWLFGTACWHCLRSCSWKDCLGLCVVPDAVFRIFHSSVEGFGDVFPAHIFLQVVSSDSLGYWSVNELILCLVVSSSNWWELFEFSLGDICTDTARHDQASKSSWLSFRA